MLDGDVADAERASFEDERLRGGRYGGARQAHGQAYVGGLANAPSSSPQDQDEMMIEQQEAELDALVMDFMHEEEGAVATSGPGARRFESLAGLMEEDDDEYDRLFAEFLGDDGMEGMDIS